MMIKHIDSYLEYLRLDGCSPHTVLAYGSDLRQLAASIAGTGADAGLDQSSVRAWIAELRTRGVSGRSIARKIAVVRSFGVWLIQHRILAENPAVDLPPQRSARKLPDTLSQTTAAKLLDAPADQVRSTWYARDRCILEILYGCGLRPAELVAIDLDHVDADSRWVRARGKGKKERLLPFGATVAAALTAYLAERKDRADKSEQALILNNCHGRKKRITTRAVQDIVKQAALLVLGDATVHPHSLRHAYATHLLADGADLRTIQELLGHANLRVTVQYCRLNAADLVRVYDRAHPKA